MKNSIFYILLIMGLFSCSNSQYDLDKMEAAVKQHIRNNDVDNGTITKIDNLKAISYEKIPEGNREHSDDVYRCKVFIQGHWSYQNSYRVFNMNDTINCYFNSKKVFFRMDNIYVN
jgi:hypothetical protein